LIKQLLGSFLHRWQDGFESCVISSSIILWRITLRMRLPSMDLLGPSRVKRGLQTRDAEMDLARLVGDLD